MKLKHTDGPWKLQEWCDTENHVVFQEAHGNAEHSIAFVESVNPADKYLITASPLLLEALQMAFDRDLSYLSDFAQIPRQDVVRARLAIRAALGMKAN